MKKNHAGLLHARVPRFALVYMSPFFSVGTLAGAELRGPQLRCPRCLTNFDVVHAGAGANGAHLDPLPLLTRDGVLSVALHAEPTGAPT